MKLVATVLVTFLGLVAWAGNGIERDYIDFGTTILSLELKSRLNTELAQAFPHLVQQPPGPVARLGSMHVGPQQMEGTVYEFALIVVDSSGQERIFTIVLRQGTVSFDDPGNFGLEVVHRELKDFVP